MNDFVFHPATAASIDRFLVHPSHASMIIGPTGSGKSSTARYLAASLIKIAPESLSAYPYVNIVRPIDNKAIPIESIRELQRFMTLKIPAAGGIARIAVIEDAHLLTTEAQNALLKLLEEPPADTAIILTASSTEALLPTIRSRVQVLHMVPPLHEDLKEHFIQKNFEVTDIEKAVLVSGGLPGLTHALLTSDNTHPLHEATVQARSLLQATAYERLLMVDSLGKQRQLITDILFILGQMSRMAVLRSSDTSTKSTLRWQNVMKASFEAQEQIRRNASAKLVLTHLMLEL